VKSKCLIFSLSETTFGTGFSKFATIIFLMPPPKKKKKKKKNPKIELLQNFAK